VETYGAGMAHDHQIFVGLDYPHGALAVRQTYHFGILGIGLRFQSNT
jgi:hypothetical protein